MVSMIVMICRMKTIVQVVLESMNFDAKKVANAYIIIWLAIEELIVGMGQMNPGVLIGEQGKYRLFLLRSTSYFLN